jgi:UDP-N-acetylglucosamine diphosphorylase/glucosamine-1-phosphate N-acetyltransferase|tara:strand:+ start:736 stop:1944 length:1209 start_codon:yes stop_codon:yes gene_type:complete
MKLYVYEDIDALNLEPIALTQPTFNIRSGAFTCLERLIKFFPSAHLSFIVRDALADFVRERYSKFEVNPTNIEKGIWVLGNVLWTKQDIDFIIKGGFRAYERKNKIIAANFSGQQGKEWINNGGPLNIGVLNKRLINRRLKSPVINYLWDAVKYNPTQIRNDSQFFKLGHVSIDSNKVTFINPERIFVDDYSNINFNTILDASEGEIIIDKNVEINPFCYLKGPLFIGENTVVQPYTFVKGGTTIGPFSRICGEISQTIIQGLTNKSHNGYLGNSYIGQNVNFGAGTNCSNLKNNYNNIKVQINKSIINTNSKKIGCFVGDYTMTAIGTCLNTGTVVGTGCNIVSSGFPPKYLPPFTWYFNRKSYKYKWNKFVSTVEIVNKRKGLHFSKVEKKLLKKINSEI